jgi:dUTP pyrophosphatase
MDTKQKSLYFIYKLFFVYITYLKKITMIVKIKKLHPNAVIPSYSKPGDAGLDLTCVNKDFEYERGLLTLYFGIAIEIPEGHVGLLFPRSSIYKKDAMLSNGVGVIDSGYRGEVMAKFRANSIEEFSVGERCVQLMIIPYPEVEFEEVNELSETERGTGGYGSTSLKSL